MAGIGSAPGIILGTGVGFAASAALAPAVEVPKQEAWAGAPNRILDAALVARLVAQGGIDLSAAQEEARRDGFAEDKLAAMIYLEQTAPGSGEALSLWRLGLIGDDLFKHALVKAGLDTRYADAIIKRKTAEVIGLGDVATAIVRGAVPAPSWVPVAPPAQTDNVPRFPVTNVDPVELAAALGFDEQMLRIMVARSGLSLAPILATNALFRGVLTENDWLLAIAEGDLRTEWAETLKEASRQILTAGEYAELELRGFLTTAERRKQTRRHGMTDADSDLLYDVLGRAPSVHAITTGIARGGTFNGPADHIPDVYLSSMQRSNARPEYYNIEYANRYSYPSAFVLRSLAEAGDLGDTAAVEQILLEIGWPPHLAKEVAAKWVPSTVAATDPHVKKAQTTLFTEAHKAYVKSGLSVAQVTPAFTALNIPDAAQAQIVGLWDVEKQLAADVPPAA